MKLDTKLPDWLATAIRPGGGRGATIWAHIDDGVDTSPWPLGPASTMPSSSASPPRPSGARRPPARAVGSGARHAGLGGRRRELRLGAQAVLPRLPVAGRRDEGRPHP